jgi:hypothetical protein
VLLAQATEILLSLHNKHFDAIKEERIGGTQPYYYY